MLKFLDCVVGTNFHSINRQLRRRASAGKAVPETRNQNARMRRSLGAPET
jgi:hypothetical protein